MYSSAIAEVAEVCADSRGKGQKYASDFAALFALSLCAFGILASLRYAFYLFALCLSL
jgi:hypothetical protein